MVAVVSHTPCCQVKIKPTVDIMAAGFVTFIGIKQALGMAVTAVIFRF